MKSHILKLIPILLILAAGCVSSRVDTSLGVHCPVAGRPPVYQPSRPAPAMTNDSVSWLHRYDLNPYDQKNSNACSLFALASWVNIRHGRRISDEDVMQVYRYAVRLYDRERHGGTLRFHEAFEAAKQAGWLKPDATFSFAANLSELENGPLLVVYNETPFHTTDGGTGSMFVPDNLWRRGLHMVVIVAASHIHSQTGQSSVWVLNSWGARWGWRGIGVMSEQQHNRMLYSAMYAINE